MHDLFSREMLKAHAMQPHTGYSARVRFPMKGVKEIGD